MEEKTIVTEIGNTKLTQTKDFIELEIKNRSYEELKQLLINKCYELTNSIREPYELTDSLVKLIELLIKY